MRPELKEKFNRLDSATQKNLVMEVATKWSNPEYSKQPYGCDLLFITDDEVNAPNGKKVYEAANPQVAIDALLWSPNLIRPALYAASSTALLKKVDSFLARQALQQGLFSEGNRTSAPATATQDSDLSQERPKTPG